MAAGPALKARKGPHHKLNSLLQHAASIGCRVYFLPIDDQLDGYLSANGDIVINSRMTETYQREVLAHELGHVHHGHDWRAPHDEPRDERQADLYAARLLISPVEYAAAEQLHSHPGAIAKELGVSQYLIELWQGSLAA